MQAFFSSFFPRLRFWLIAICAFVIVESMLQLALAMWVGRVHPGYAGALALNFPLGIVDHLATGLLLGLPFLIGLEIRPAIWQKRWVRIFAQIILVVFCGGLAFGFIAQLMFWNEFDSRLNGVAVYYIMFPKEVVGNITESFDMRIALPLCGLLTLIIYWPLRRSYIAALAAPPVKGERKQAAIIGAGALALGLAYFAFPPLDLSGLREVDEVSSNGLHRMISAALSNDSRYDGLYVGLPETEALKRAKSLVAQDNTTDLTKPGERSLLRRVENPGPPKKLNIILVLEESFGYEYFAKPDPKTQKPIAANVQRLAKDGIFFDNFFATGNRTVRALEAVLCSFPPLPGISTSRRPGSEGMNSLGFMLKKFGYDTAFLYGGEKLFDNMGYFWQTTGFDKVWDQDDIAHQPFTTIWGVADEFLFTEAIKRMDVQAATGKPIYLGLLTVTNHRPYTYPEGRIPNDPKIKRRESAATYADWAFGDFIERARGKPWFDDTVFIFIGDHGPRIYGAALVPVPSYQVPFLIYAPKHFVSQTVSTLGSSLDVAPTLLGLLGFSYDSPFFGVDLLRQPKEKGRVFMEHNFSVAYGDGEKVSIISAGMKSRGFRMSGDVRFPLAEEPTPNPEHLAHLIATIQTAHRMFYAREYHELSSEK